VRVVIESGRKRTFASAVDWPGWCRSARSEPDALAALAAYAPRYRQVAAVAGVEPPDAGPFDVVERQIGDATTDFGAPGVVAAADREPLSPAEADRLCKLLEASWSTFDRIARTAPQELRKGPRGGGRDRDAITAHVHDAEAAYATRLGLRAERSREVIARALRSGTGAGRWPARYAVRRMAWHVLDHAWEIEDRS
jgi:hypothetical protein